MRIVFTGGGSAGHVTPNLALIEGCQARGWSDLIYIGSKEGIERELVSNWGIPYYFISTARWSRRLTLKNALTPWRVFKGVVQAYVLLGQLKPDLVFSKGGFVSLPVVLGAWLRRIPVIGHESDLTPGLANRLAYPFLKVLCLTFNESAHFFKSSDKIKITGSPIRPFLLTGQRERGQLFCGFSGDRPVVLVMGGSLGATPINDLIRRALPQLIRHYDCIHVCGKDKLDLSLSGPNYRPLDYVDQALPDLLASADLVISRAGANTIVELLALKKTHILIPLVRGSRGDQLANARYCVAQGWSVMCQESELTPDSLMAEIDRAMQTGDAKKQLMNQRVPPDGLKAILSLFKDFQAHV